MKTVGVLALQGSFAEHCRMLGILDHVVPLAVKHAKDIDKIDSLILPGGESTTLGKLLKDFNLDKVIVERIRQGMPVWGTCAGMILLAQKIIGEDHVHFGVMDIEVRRNSYGGQLNSFSSRTIIEEVSEDPIPLVFIRAPWIERVHGDVKVLAEHQGKIIAARQGNMICTSFHPELTKDLSFYKYFIRF